MGVIPFGEVFLFDLTPTAGAFGDILTRHLDVDTPGVCPFGMVDGEEVFDLRENGVECACLVSVGGVNGVAVHGIAGPDDTASFSLRPSDQRR